MWTLGTASLGYGRTCGSNASTSGAFALRKTRALSCSQSNVFNTFNPKYATSKQTHTRPCQALNEDEAEDDEKEGENPELKLLVDLIVEYPATRGTLAVLFG